LDSGYVFTPGKTVNEKADNMCEMIMYLENILGVDLDEINGMAIVMERDSASAISLLEVILGYVEGGIKNGSLVIPKFNLFTLDD
jgi:hypothetical protein